MRHIPTVKLAIGPVPARRPVERTGKGKSRQLHIGHLGRAVGDGIFDHCAQRVVDFAFLRPQVDATLLGQQLVTGPDYALAKIAHHALGIAAQKGLEPVKAGARRSLCPLGAMLQLFESEADALEQNLLLVAEMMVDDRLGYAETGRHILK